MQLQISHVSYTYPQASLAALHDVSLTFTAGWTGIVGDNGCGKTTLAKIACGLLRPDEGHVTANLFSAYCQQDASQAPDNLFDFAADWSTPAQKLRHQLLIDDEWIWRYDTLSGGQQKRLQIACALWSEPDLLVMDEPTNELDARTRIIVSNALSHFDGIGLLVSHDKTLLNTLCTQCVLFENGTFVARPGSYEQACLQAQRDHSFLVRQHDKAQREAKRIESEALRRQQEAQKSAQKRSGRKLDVHDADAREKRGRAIVSGKDGVAGKLSATMNARLDKAQDLLQESSIPKRYNAQFKTYGIASSKPILAHLDACIIGDGGFALHVPELWVERYDHVIISGDNGCGKSLLINELLKHIGNDVSVAYLPQKVDEDIQAKALQQLSALPTKSQGDVLAIVGNLNSDPKRILDGKNLSPGELKKLSLALQLVNDPNLIVLDEPTNHLDMGSINALTQLLQTFSGAYILVTHDQSLIETLNATKWNIAENLLTVCL